MTNRANKLPARYCVQRLMLCLVYVLLPLTAGFASQSVSALAARFLNTVPGAEQHTATARYRTAVVHGDIHAPFAHASRVDHAKGGAPDDGDRGTCARRGRGHTRALIAINSRP